MIDPIVSKEFRVTVIGLFPKLENNPAYLRLIFHLLSSYKPSLSVQEIVVSSEILAECEGVDRATVKNNNYNGLKFLNAFKADVLPNLEWKDHSYINGEARAVTSLGLTENELQDLLALLNQDTFELEEVFFVSGRQVNRKSIAEEEQRLKDKIQADLESELYPTAKVPLIRAMIEYHLDLDKKLYANRISKDRLIEVRQQFGGLYNWLHLNQIRHFPKPYYRFSNWSARLRPIGLNLTNVESEIRRALIPDAVELDLKSAHLAIAAMLWDCRRLKNLLRDGKVGGIEQPSGTSAWKYLQHAINVGDEYKPTIKKFTYSLVYGASLRGSKKHEDAKGAVGHFEDECKKLSLDPSDYAEKLLKDVLIKELVDKRQAREKQIWKQRQVKTVLGYSTIEAKNHDDVRSILSIENQAYEQLLVYEIYRVAMEPEAKEAFTILVYSYDGVSLVFRPGVSKKAKEDWLECIKNAVKSKADELKIATELEVKYLS